MSSVKTATVETNIPARLDRLPWSRFHWLVIVGLGTVWILDGLEVTIVGSIGGRLTEQGSGISISSGQIGTAGAIYVVGACLGALFFGQLTDRFGRKKLFMVTLAVYIVATAATAFSFAPWYFFVCRLFTGAGIGGEYAAINSAIDELIPARVRGRVDLAINGSFWIGSVIGSAVAILFLDRSIFAADVGWRLEFGVGVVLAFGILIVRRHVPESPRWLFIHGREQEAERIVDGIEGSVEEQTSKQLEAPDKTIEVRQRKAIPFREIARVAFKSYPRRAALGFALFVGQAFIYNGITFNLGTLFTTFYGIGSGFVPVFVIIFGVGNFLGPMLLGRLFDTIGRKPMIASMYLGSALLTVPMAILFTTHAIGAWAFEAFVFGIFFLASSGASAAYLTVSEIFPMETRALAIAFFYAIGTAAGGITGPLLFGHLINTDVRGNVAIAFLIGAAVMAIGGIAEILFGVPAEQAQLEDIAQPLTADEAEQEPSGEVGDHRVEDGQQGDTRPEHRVALDCRSRAEEWRARAAEHRAAVHELTAQGGPNGERVGVERVLAEIADLSAGAMDERAAGHDARADADEADEARRDAALQRAEAAEACAEAYEEQVRALGAEHEADGEHHRALAEAAGERARARAHRSEAAQARGQADAERGDGAKTELARARAELHERWAETYAARGQARVARADGDEARAADKDGVAAAAEELALAAEQRAQAAEHRVLASEASEGRDAATDAEQRRAEEAEHSRSSREIEERIRARVGRRRQREASGLRRFRPGLPRRGGAPWLATPEHDADEHDREREINMIVRVLSEHGATQRRDLARLVGARFWGPGRFGRALSDALDDGRVRRVSRSTYAPDDGDDPTDGRG